MNIPLDSTHIEQLILRATETATSILPIAWLIGGMILGFALVRGLISVFRTTRNG